MCSPNVYREADLRNLFSGNKAPHHVTRLITNCDWLSLQFWSVWLRFQPLLTEVPVSLLHFNNICLDCSCSTEWGLSVIRLALRLSRVSLVPGDSVQKSNNSPRQQDATRRERRAPEQRQRSHIDAGTTSKNRNQFLLKQNLHELNWQAEPCCRPKNVMLLLLRDTAGNMHNVSSCHQTEWQDGSGDMHRWKCL